ncbi:MULTISPECIES: hypothetical protein [Aerococcus]|uniref:hypothetical protein n=1 Tax=Aerococcus TaxID=1375 RepID=UPI0018A74726|nr:MULTISPECIES: hypothetical protein [Aerococcus]MCY3067643.1 hypothetical protein [Aerococcus mictus]MCY3080455.1 hypothetical protein [Aerococcus mictus]MDK8484518.1 hypothetical protein [Aerococcus urinae]
MYASFKINNLSQKEFKFMKVVTYPDNLYFNSGDTVFIQDFSYSQDYWKWIEDGDFLLLPTNGKTAEALSIMQCKITKERIIFQPLSSYVGKEPSIYTHEEAKSLPIFGKALARLTKYDERVNTSKFKLFDN